MRDRIKTFQDFVADEENKQGKIGKVCTITFQITDECNLNCSYCYQINKGHHIMPIEIAQDFIDMIFNNNKNLYDYINFNEFSGCIIEFIGGEPFLQVKLMDQILDYFILKLKNSQPQWLKYWCICITSNGTLYFNPQVQQFIKKWICHLSLSISIDGNKELHDKCRTYLNGKGSYDDAIKAALHYSNNYNQALITKMTLSPDNIKYASDAYINLINLGYKDIDSNYCFEEGWTIDHAKILYQELKKVADYIIFNNKDIDLYFAMFRNFQFRPMLKSINDNWCGSNDCMITLDYNGNLYPCIRFTESSLGSDQEPLIIGTIKYHDLIVNEKNQKCINCLHNITRISQSPKKCIKCKIADGCAWCTAYNYQKTGSVNKRVTYICELHHARALANAYFWNLYYQKYHIKKRFKIWLSKKEALKIINEQEWALLKKLEKPVK